MMKKRVWSLGVSGIMLAYMLTGCGGGQAASATTGAGDYVVEPSAAATTAAAAEEKYALAAEGGAEETAAGAPGETMPEMSGQSRQYGGERRYADSYQRAYGGDYINSEEYHAIVEQGFQSVADQPLSTFSIDVDTASYSNIRRMISRGAEIPKDAVRIEEMINYFNYDYPEPEGGEPFSVTTELADCPWNQENRLMLIGLQAEDIDFDRRPMSNLVFLLDVSGSMYDEDKLPLVQKSFSMLTEELTENDRVSIVTYAGYEEVVLEGARGDEKARIREALEGLTAGGSTAGEAGINQAYALAERYYIPGGNNRVILATDGDLNVGVSSEEGLTSLIEKKREGGVHLSVLGFGSGNIKDNKMEALADHGDGNYHYIDSLREAQKVLVEEMGGTLITVAKDVKIQVEFNPAWVKGYRLVGYENRALADEDFDNDRVDAGEIGSGHRVTALYEIVPGQQETADLKYQKQESEAAAGEVLTVNLRYKAPNGNDSKLLSVPVMAGSYQADMPDNLKFASAVAEFGMLLRDSEYKGSTSYEMILNQVAEIPQDRMDDYKEEFCKLVKMKRSGW